MNSASIDSGRGRVALLVGHCAGMVDLVGLPLWVGVLIEVYGFDPQQAGGLATLFLAGIVLASLVIAPRFHRVSGRIEATVGFALAAVCFFVAATTRDTALLVAMHFIGGLAAGTGLSVTHGTISKGTRPHRLMAMAGVALGVFAVIFMASVPKIIGTHGGPALFVVFGVVMVVATLVALTSFPSTSGAVDDLPKLVHSPEPLPRAVWFGLIAYACMCLVHAMANSFLERVGMDHGFTRDQVGTALLTMALISMFPGALAAYLENRISVRAVLFFAPIFHVAMVALLMNTTQLPLYMAAMATLPSLMIFMHTFSFGALAKGPQRPLAGSFSSVHHDWLSARSGDWWDLGEVVGV